MDITGQGDQAFNCTGLSKINVLLGKNGSGKSTLLKKIEQGLQGENIGEVNYVTPERGGILTYNSNIEQSIRTEDWADNEKRKNQWGNFKHYSVSQYRKLEIISLRELEANQALRQDAGYSFNTIIDKINALLSNVQVKRSGSGDFDIFQKGTADKIDARAISSGESELISLAIECLTFEKLCQVGRDNYLLLDEPDVHLHPDLQASFISFLIELISTNKFNIIIATHSSAILGALFDYEHSRFAILQNGSTSVAFQPITEKYQNILPIFGAHPLSNLFNQSPILLVEGEDDVRIFQQAIRTSAGQLKLYPCSVDGVGNMTEYETSVIEIINGVYDNARAYSLRDKDEGVELINDIPPLIRIKTSCRAAENLILSDEVLANLNVSWNALEAEIERWLLVFPQHGKFAEMAAFKASGYDRKQFDLKEIRNVLVGLTDSNKPWEIAVGQVMGNIATGTVAKDFNDNKLCNYLGQKLSNLIRP